MRHRYIYYLLRYKNQLAISIALPANISKNEYSKQYFCKRRIINYKQQT